MCLFSVYVVLARYKQVKLKGKTVCCIYYVYTTVVCLALEWTYCEQRLGGQAVSSACSAADRPTDAALAQAIPGPGTG